VSAKKVWFITGAGRGMGVDFAKAALAAGHAVVATGRDPDAVAKALGRSSNDLLAVKLDVTRPGDADAAVRAAVDRFGRIDVLVNNAALFQDLDKEDHSYDYLQRAFRVNLHGAWLMARAVAPTMVAQQWGRIINISSVGAYMHPTFDAPFEGVHSWVYNQTKWGILGLTKYLAGQLGQYNITVNCIAPGVTLSDGARNTLTPERIEELRMMSAMRRTVEPADLAGVVAFFASDDASVVTGQVLCVDAGTCMPA
jgi:3-oxoacyl-[acyl-carrier protein] reductase